MVVDDIENQFETAGMREIGKVAQVVRLPIKRRGSKKTDSIVTPAVAAWEIGDRHHLNGRDAEVRQRRQLLRCGTPCPFAGECAYVQFVDHALLASPALPISIVPLKG